MAKPSKLKALDALNKLNNYSKLPFDHRWVSTVRHYIKDNPRTSTNTGSPKLPSVSEVMRQMSIDSFDSPENIVTKTLLACQLRASA